MKLSIIVPVYNVEKYIEECLDSIYNGNLADFEVLCIDDKGNDLSINIIEKYVEKNKIKNLRIIHHEKNKGLSEARNTGIKHAKGKYICFLDSDDMIYANALNELVEQAIKEDLDIIEGNIKEIFETKLNIKSRDITNLRRETTQILTGDEYFYTCSRNKEYLPMACCRIFKTEYLKEKYYFIPELKYEDEEFSPKAIIGANRVQYYNETFYIYRRRDDSITTNIVKDNKWVESYLKIINSLSEFSDTIKDKKSYIQLKNRIANLALSILKNPVAYGTTEGKLQEIIKLVKNQKIYKIPQKSKNLFIRIQGYIMKYPNLFIKLYKRK